MFCGGNGRELRRRMKTLTQKGKDLGWFLILVLLLATSGFVATSGFSKSQVFVDISENPTPLGYTKSLILFALPCLVFGYWLLTRREIRVRRKAFWITILLTFPLGVLLDVFLGLQFFTFPNRDSILGGRYDFFILWAYDVRQGFAGLPGPGWRKFIPVEEVFFYFLGFVAILLTYIWADEVIFRENRVSVEQPVASLFAEWKRTILFWLAIGAILFLVALVIRAQVKPEGKDAFPGYFLFLLLTAIIPSMACSRLAFYFVNFRALTLAWLFVLTISLFWEACLAIPYQWWGYRNDQMMGWFIKPQCNLPIEAVLVWTLATWTTALLFETIQNVLRLKEMKTEITLRKALRGEADNVRILQEHYHSGREKSQAEKPQS